MRATEGAAPESRRLEWLTAEIVVAVDETPRVRTLRLKVPGWPGHLPGQHVDVRLTDPDGYQAQRSYSIASAPASGALELTIQRLDTGEVSPYLTTEARPGDVFQLRGPVGYHFVWTAERGGPLFLIAGGSGVVPLMAMLRHRKAVNADIPAVLLYSSRTLDDVIYRAELDHLAAGGTRFKLIHTLTDIVPPNWRGETGRINLEMLERSGFPPEQRPRVFACGPTGLVEAAARALVELGHDPLLVKTERFGPTGA